MRKILGFGQNKKKGNSGPTDESVSNNFKKLVSALSDSQTIEKCIIFFLDNYLNLDDEQLNIIKTNQNLNINQHLFTLLEIYIPFFESNIRDKSKWESGFSFLSNVIIFLSTTKIEDSPFPSNITKSLCNVLLTILDTNDSNIFELANNCILTFLENDNIKNVLFKYNFLVNVYHTVFVKNDMTSLNVSEHFIKAVHTIEYNDIDEVQQFLDAVILSIYQNQIANNALIPKCLEFVCAVMLLINTDPFVDIFIEALKSIQQNIPDLSFIQTLFSVKTNHINSVWDLINEICLNPDTSLSKVRTIINIFPSIKDLSPFKANSLLQRFNLYTHEELALLLNVMKNQNIDYKFAFVCNSCPPWEHHMNPTFFENLIVTSNFDEVQIQTIIDILILSQKKMFFKYLSFSPFKRLVDFLLNNLSETTPIVSDLLIIFLEYLNTQNQSNATQDLLEINEAVNSFSKKLFIKGNIKILIEAIFTFFNTNANAINDVIFNLLSDIILQCEGLSKSFIEYSKENTGKNILYVIKDYLNKMSAVDCLAALANDGPFDEIDHFIINEFEQSPLSKLQPKYLCNLMLGLPHDSCYDGLVRIPSLCKYIEEVPIKTPFDKYVVANKFDGLKEKDMIKCSSFFIQTPNLDLNSTFLKYISSPEYFHFNVYQAHYSMRHAYAKLPTSPMISIWIYFEKLISETLAISSPLFNIYIGFEELKIVILANTQNSNDQTISIPFSLMSWQLLTFSRITPTFGSSFIYIYLNNKKIAEIPLKNSQCDLILGSDDCNNAIWYISNSIQANLDTHESNIDNIINQGPGAYSQIKLNCGTGLPYLKYRGIAAFLNCFNIFDLMLTSQTELDFINYLQTALNLFKIGLIKPYIFYPGIRYCIQFKSEFITKEVEDLIHNAMFIKDFQIISNEKLELSWVKDLNVVNLKTNSTALNNANITFINGVYKFLLNSILFLNLSPTKTDFFLEVIFKHILYQKKEKINQLFLAVEVLSSRNFYEIGNKNLNNFQNDEHIQHKIFDFYKANSNTFGNLITKQKLYQLINFVPNEIALDILDFLSPQYFDISQLEDSAPRFILLTHYESFWLSMFSFLLDKKITSFDKISQHPVKHENIFPLMIKLLSISLKCQASVIVLPILLSLIQTVHVSPYIDYLRLLCSLGYLSLNSVASSVGNESDNSCDENSSNQPISLSLVSRISNLSNSNLTGSLSSFSLKSNNNILTQISPYFYEDTIQYLNSNTITAKIDFANNEDIIAEDKIKVQKFFPEARYSNDRKLELSEIEKTNIEIICEANCKFLMRTMKNVNKFKSYLYKLTIQGKNVVNDIAIMIHQSTILKFISLNKNMSNKIAETIGSLLINRISEGWWGSSDENSKIFEIFNAMSPFFSPSNFAKDFIISCVLKSNEDDAIKMLVLLLNFRHFSDYVAKEPFLSIFALYLHKYGLLETNKDLIIQSFPPNNEFTKSVKNGVFIDFFANNEQCYNYSNEFTQKLNKTVTDYNRTLNQLRYELSSNLISTLTQKCLINYQNLRIRNLYITNAFKYQFLIRINKSNTELETFISYLLTDTLRLYHPHNITNYNETSSHERYMLVPSTSPFHVPMKTVPLQYFCELPFGLSFKKSNVKIPVARFQTTDKTLPLKNHLFDDSNIDLLRERLAPSCLQKVDLPTYSKMVDITQLFKQKFNIPNSNNNLFQCGFLSYLEAITCVCCYSKDSKFILLMNAKLEPSQFQQQSSTSPNTTSSQSTQLSSNTSRLINPRIVFLENENPHIYDNVSFGLAYSRIVGGYVGKWSLFMNHVVLAIDINDIREILPRRHIYLNIGLEIFTQSGIHISLLMSERERKQFISHVKSSNAFSSPAANSLNLTNSNSISIADTYAKHWQNGEISNFDYLLILNVIGSRSFNDLSQYPVFPWIISDHVSKQLDFNTDKTFRKLERPIGVQTDDRIERFTIVYNETEPHYHYGSHYSHPAAVLHYLLRVEPHTMLNLHMHGGWDHRDRLFYDVVESWHSVSESKQIDTKELIPEFFCYPGLFEDGNNIKLPPRTDGKRLDVVNLPPWANNSSLTYIWKMRTALESKIVHQKISEWIDLIFGFKQRGQAAVDAINVYQPFCYDTCRNQTSSEIEDEDDELQFEADQDAMINFGQCPSQLFLSQHISPNTENANYIDNLIHNSIVILERRISRLKELPKGTTFIKYIPDSSSLFALSAKELILSGINIKVHSSSFENTSNKSFMNFEDSIQIAAMSPNFRIVSFALRNGCVHSIVGEGSVMKKELPIVSTQLMNLTKDNNSDNPKVNFFSFMKNKYIRNIAISEKHFLLAAQVGKRTIYSYDLTSGRFLRQYKFHSQVTTPETEKEIKIIKLSYMDDADFLVICTSNEIEVLGIDFRHVAYYGEVKSPITCLSTSDPNLWNEKPFFVTGHENGHCNLYEINVEEGTIKEIWLMENNENPIIALTIFSSNKAVIACDINGTTVMASTMNLKHKLLKSQYFKTCSICAEELGKKRKICSHCRLAVCSKCYEKKSCIGCLARLNGS